MHEHWYTVIEYTVIEYTVKEYVPRRVWGDVGIKQEKRALRV